MPRVTTFLTAAFAARAVHAQRVLRALGKIGGRFGSADRFAKSLGYRNRHQLARAIKAAGLPPLERLAQWTQVLRWLVDAERQHCTLHQLSKQGERDVAMAYRLVRRVTGLTWTQVQARGPGWVMVQIRKRHPPKTGVLPTPRSLQARGNAPHLVRPPVSL